MAGCRNELNDTRSIAKVNNSLARRLVAVIHVVGRGNREEVFAPGQGGTATTFGPSLARDTSFILHPRAIYMRNSTNEFVVQVCAARSSRPENYIKAVPRPVTKSTPFPVVSANSRAE